MLRFFLCPACSSLLSSNVSYDFIYFALSLFYKGSLLITNGLKLENTLLSQLITQPHFNRFNILGDISVINPELVAYHLSFFHLGGKKTWDNASLQILLDPVEILSKINLFVHIGKILSWELKKSIQNSKYQKLCV